MTTDPHIRPIVLRTDLAAVADLVETCFLSSMDIEGIDYLRHIRQIAKGLGGFLAEGTTPENSQLPFHGYIWEEEGRIIGNLTLIHVRRKDPHTYLIANVAVHPGFRGRGIAQQLTERAIQHVREHGGTKIFLQVRDDNPPAIHIYQASGFIEDARRTTWIYDSGGFQHKQEVGCSISRRKTDDWTAQRNWLMETYPASIAWNMPFQLYRLAPGIGNWLRAFMYGGMLGSWSVRGGGRLLGVGTWEKGFSAADYLWIGADPEKESEVLRALIPVVGRKLLGLSKFHVNYPDGRGVDAFIETGMKKAHTLIWMSMAISNVDEDI